MLSMRRTRQFALHGRVHPRAGWSRGVDVCVSGRRSLRSGSASCISTGGVHRSAIGRHQRWHATTSISLPHTWAPRHATLPLQIGRAFLAKRSFRKTGHICTGTDLTFVHARLVPVERSEPVLRSQAEKCTTRKPADKLPRRRTLAASLQRVKPLNSRVSISTSHSIFADFVRSTYRLRKGRFERREPVLSELGRVRSHLHGGTSGHEDA